MSSSGDAAEQVVRMSLNGIEIAAKISGKAAERLAVLLYAVLKDQKRTKGKVRLTNMLRSGKELKVFAVQDGELEKFSRAAKQYGVLYCMLKDRKDNSGLTDIMVRADDAGKINRIFERFSLATIDMASVKTEIERSKAEQAKTGEGQPAPERSDQVKDKVDDFMKKVVPEENPSKEKNTNENPSSARTAKSSLSGPSSGDRKMVRSDMAGYKARTEARNSEEERMLGNRPSVRKEMDEIRKEQKLQKETGRSRDRNQQKTLRHKAPKRKRSGKERSS